MNIWNKVINNKNEYKSNLNMKVSQEENRTTEINYLKMTVMKRVKKKDEILDSNSNATLWSNIPPIKNQKGIAVSMW